MKRISDYGFNRFIKDCRGGTMLIFALSFIPVVLVAGLAVDFSRIAKTRTQMSYLMDGALLLAAQRIAQDDTLDPKTVVENALQKTWNIVGVNSFTVNAVKLPNNRLQGDLSLKLPTTLMHVAGVNSVDIKVNSEVAIDSDELEIVMVLDNTGSMGWSGKIGTLKTAARNLVNTLIPNSSTKNVKIGIVPFSRYVNVGTSNAGASWLTMPASGSWGGCVASRTAPYNKQDDNYTSYKVPAVSSGNASTCPVAITPLTDKPATLKSAINSMTANGYTYIPGGLVWGWRVLSKAAPFTQGSAKSKTNVKRAVILMTDGENTVSPSSGGKLHNGSNISLSDSNLTAICNNMKAPGEKIKIYTIAFSVTNNNIKTLLQNCATTTSDYYDAANSSLLLAAFKNITLSLKNLRLTK